MTWVSRHIPSVIATVVLFRAHQLREGEVEKLCYLAAGVCVFERLQLKHLEMVQLGTMDLVDNIDVDFWHGFHHVEIERFYIMLNLRLIAVVVNLRLE